MLWSLVLVPVLTVSTPHRSAVAVHEEFRRIAAQPLWPGFDPLAIPLAVFDGKETVLFQHPKPPAGFRARAGGTFVFDGKHETVRANTGTEVNGIPTATADLGAAAARPVAESAALLVHEAFHVFQRKAHPAWIANEGDLFNYPMDDAEGLFARRLETLALVRALDGADPEMSRQWARTALSVRRSRFTSLTAEAAAYERGSELNEGLAQYVEDRSLARRPRLSSADFAADAVRLRAYGTGEALAVLLDRFAPDWKAQLDTTSLDEVLFARLGPGEQVAFSGRDSSQERTRAQKDAALVVASRAERHRTFLATPGWKIEIVAGKEPLWPQGFDPLNIANVGMGTLLHSRWVKLGNARAVFEVLDRTSLTEGAGTHPLFQGVRRLIVTGVAEPSLTQNAGKVTLVSAGVKGTFEGSIDLEGTTATIRLP